MEKETFIKQLYTVKEGSTKFEVLCQQACSEISPKILNVDVTGDGAFLEMEKNWGTRQGK